jgi:hypothetical protein
MVPGKVRVLPGLPWTLDAAHYAPDCPYAAESAIRSWRNVLSLTGLCGRDFFRVAPTVSLPQHNSAGERAGGVGIACPSPCAYRVVSKSAAYFPRS